MKHLPQRGKKIFSGGLGGYLKTDRKTRKHPPKNSRKNGKGAKKEKAPQKEKSNFSQRKKKERENEKREKREGKERENEKDKRTETGENRNGAERVRQRTKNERREKDTSEHGARGFAILSFLR